MRVLPNYVFIGIARREEEWRKTVKRTAFEEFEASLFVNDQIEVLLVQHRSHLERLLQLVSLLDETTKFVDAYFGCEVQATAPRHYRDDLVNLMFVSPKGNLCLALLEGETNDPFCQTFRMFGEKWVLLYPQNASFSQTSIPDIIRRSSTREMIGLSKIWKHSPNPKEQHRKKSKYDATRARTRELEYQFTQAKSFIRNELEYLNSLMKTDELQGGSFRAFNPRFKLIKSLLEAENDRISEMSGSLTPSFGTIEACTAILDTFGLVISTLRLDSYHQRIKDRWKKTSSQLLDSVEILNVEDAFALEAYNSLSLRGLCPIVIPSRDYNCRIVDVLNNIRVIELPITISPRLGLLPVVYHLISHPVAEEMARTRIVNSPALNKWIREIFSETKESECCRSGDRIFVLAREILADLIAAEIAGPAYLYAFLRAFPFEEKLCLDSFHELKQRVCLISDFLCSKGFNVESDVLPVGHLDMPDHLSPSISELISELTLSSHYSPATHESILRSVKPALVLGDVIPTKPSFVTNALWDAVLNRSDYLNENAAFLSILKWLRQTEIYELG